MPEVKQGLGAMGEGGVAIKEQHEGFCGDGNGLYLACISVSIMVVKIP